MRTIISTHPMIDTLVLIQDTNKPESEHFTIELDGVQICYGHDNPSDAQKCGVAGLLNLVMNDYLNGVHEPPVNGTFHPTWKDKAAAIREYDTHFRAGRQIAQLPETGRDELDDFNGLQM